VLSEDGYNKAITNSIKGIRERVRRFGRFINSLINTSLIVICNNNAFLVVDLF